jgi:hypothetical protein
MQMLESVEGGYGSWLTRLSIKLAKLQELNMVRARSVRVAIERGPMEPAQRIFDAALSVLHHLSRPRMGSKIFGTEPDRFMRPENDEPESLRAEQRVIELGVLRL